MTFDRVFDEHPWKSAEAQLNNIGVRDVERALSKVGKLSPFDFLALLSECAKPYLEDMAQLSYSLTRKRFGKTMQLYAPMYLSNECQNICTYCGFRYDNALKRKTLSDEEILAEASEIKRHGFDHILLVTGEAQKTVGMSYFLRALELVRPLFSNISFEVQPLDEEDYRTLSQEGVHSVLVYQETYHEDRYRLHHPKGKKSNFRYRLETPERLGRA
ncbi:MAG: radical SAM protein, partial [Bdellovibrionales bacterium]|nr:radical SAM protein [Bdellovibrionales bacterium]